MKIAATNSQPFTLDTELLAIGVPQDLSNLTALDARYDGALLEWLRARHFKPGAGDLELVPSFGKIGARSLALVGIGNGSTQDLAAAAGKVGRVARDQRIKNLALDLGPLSDDARQIVIEYLAIGNYAWDRYFADDARKPALENVSLANTQADTLQAQLPKIELRQRYQTLARDLVNLAPADLYPERLAEIATEQAQGIDHLTIEVWDAKRCKAEGLVGITAVGQGSAREGVLIHLTYRPPNPVDHIALVGKGVTFDAGGLSLKPSAGMQTMRCDMGGAATALAATLAIASSGTPVAVDTFLPSVENLVDGTSYKLGDVLKYRNGVHVEIHNTDAEGRLILADALILASEVKGVSRIVDMATLTGAMVVALGCDYTGLFTDDDALAKELLASGHAVGDLLWRMPLHAPYKAKLKTPFATLKNVGGREAGSITAALFLQHFVRPSARWAHLDIAGSAFFDTAQDPYAAGGTGQVVRALATWAERLTR